MRKNIKYILLILLFGGVLRVTPLRAQEAIIEKQSLKSEIDQLKQSYKGQLTEYRSAANKYEIAHAQWLKLNTLASLETAVQANQELMLLRSQVLLSYLKLLELELIETEGINLEQKQPILEQIKALQLDLKAQRSLEEKADDRVKVNQVADIFMILSPKIVDSSTYARNLLSVGKLQHMADKAKVLVEETQPEEMAEPSLDLQEKIRAHKEIRDKLAEAQSQLDLLWAELKEARVKNKNLNIKKASGDIYGSLSQLIAFLSEYSK